MIYTARHRRSQLRRTWRRMDRPMSWIDVLGASALAGALTALMTMIALH